MTRKHFEAFAAALANIRPEKEGLIYGDTQRNAWQNSVGLIASVCAESNPRFDRERFLAATLEG